MLERFDHIKLNKKHIAGTYQGMLQGIWNYYADAFGWMMARDCMKVTLEDTKESHPILERVQLTGEGLSFALLCERTEDWEITTLQEAVKTFCANLIDVTTKSLRGARY